jgi:hypothetical protein
MRWRRTALDGMQQRIMQMGLETCPVCQSGQLGVLKYPSIESIGGFHREKSDPKHDPEANVLFLVHVECDMCGHVLLFNSERLEPSSSKSLVQGLTEEQEAALDDDESDAT